MRHTVKVSRAILSDDLHLWYFENAKVTQLIFDLCSLRIKAWSLDGEIEIRIGSAFTFCRDQDSLEVDFDRVHLTSLQATLCLLTDEITEMRIEKAGEMELLFRNGPKIRVACDPQYEAWEASGSVHDGFCYLCDPSGAF